MRIWWLAIISSPIVSLLATISARSATTSVGLISTLIVRLRRRICLVLSLVAVAALLIVARLAVASTVLWWRWLTVAGSATVLIVGSLMLTGWS